MTDEDEEIFEGQTQADPGPANYILMEFCPHSTGNVDPHKQLDLKSSTDQLVSVYFWKA